VGDWQYSQKMVQETVGLLTKDILNVQVVIHDCSASCVNLTCMQDSVMDCAVEDDRLQHRRSVR